jgi:hypothetical protein
MRRKPNSHSILHGLTPEQRELVDGWLFEENLSHAKVGERCGQELGVKVSRTSVRRYYERQCLARKLDGAACPAGELKKMAASLRRNSEENYSVALGRLRQLAAKEALKPEEQTDLEKLAKMLCVLIAARREGTERKRAEYYGRRVALAEQRFQFDAALECWEQPKTTKKSCTMMA